MERRKKTSNGVIHVLNSVILSGDAFYQPEERRILVDQVKTTKRMGCKIPAEVEKRIVELSYQNPEFGAKRLLPLLKLEEIDVSSSSIYRVLKRHGLQTRILRASKIGDKCLSEAPSQDDESSPTDIAPVPLAAAKPKPIVESSDKSEPSPRFFQNLFATDKPFSRGRSFLLIVNLSLLALIGYLGLLVVQNLQPSTLISDAEASIQPSPVIAAVQLPSTPRPLSDYRRIWQRNLFNIQKEKSPAPNQDITLDDIKAATTDLGLKLLGTVVMDNDSMRIAVIQNLMTAKQGIYHEKDKVEKAYVKKILRNKVVISLDGEDQLLTIKDKDFAKALGAAPPQRKKRKRIRNQSKSEEDDSFDLETSKSAPPRRKAKSIRLRLEREEVGSVLADVDGLMKRLKISPYKQDNQPSGFKISGIPRGSILRKLGLRSRDIIKGINDQVISSPAQAEDFFKTLSKGGELKIKLTRKHRDRWIHLDIE